MDGQAWDRAVLRLTLAWVTRGWSGQDHGWCIAPFCPCPAIFGRSHAVHGRESSPGCCVHRCHRTAETLLTCPRRKGIKIKKKPHFVRVQHMSQNTKPKAAYQDNKKKPYWRTSSPAPHLSYCVWIMEKKKMHRLWDNRGDGGCCRRLRRSGVLLRLSDPANISYPVPRWIISSSRARLGEPLTDDSQGLLQIW